MAASSVPSLQIHEDFKEEFLTCSICAEPYDNGEHQAKCLPCLHSYCKSCLQQHAGRRPKFNCPVCRREVTVPDGTIDNLPNNFIVETLKSYQDIFNFAISCGSCEEEGNQAVSSCHDCGCFLCHACVDNHQKMRPLRNHKLSTMAELQQKKYNPIVQQHHHCKKHPISPLTLYCKEADCKIPTCASCGLIDHRGHELVDLAGVIDEIVPDMRQSSSRVNDRSQELSRKRAAFEAEQKTLTDNFTKREKDMQTSEQRLIAMIKSQYTNTQSHLKLLYQTETNHLNASIESIDSLAAQMISACEFANKACDVSHPTKLLTSYKQIMDRLHELENIEVPDTTTSNKTELSFTNKHYSALSLMKDSLQHLGDVHWLKPKLDPRRCTIHLAEAGRSKRFRKATVKTVDINGQLMTTGGANVEAIQRKNKLEVQDNNDGTYTMECDKRLSLPHGYHFKIDTKLHVFINGTPMRGSPFDLFK